MSGYMMIMAPCYACGHRLVANPDLVPSIRNAQGRRQPVCRACVDRYNALAEEAGTKPFTIPDGAYEPQEVA